MFHCRLTQKDGKNAASLFVAEQYVHAFNKLARTNNTLILPTNVGDISSLVGHAMSIYSTISKNNDNNKNSPNESNSSNDKASPLEIDDTISQLSTSSNDREPERLEGAKFKDDNDRKKWD